MKILKKTWFTEMGGRRIIGIILIETDEGQKEAYIGTGDGGDEQADAKRIAERGAQFPLSAAHELLGGNEKDVNIVKKKFMEWINNRDMVIIPIAGRFSPNALKHFELSFVRGWEECEKWTIDFLKSKKKAHLPWVEPKPIRILNPEE